MKGHLIKGLTLLLTPEETNGPLKDLLKEHLRPADKNAPALNVKIFAPQYNRSVKLTSSLKIDINRQLLEAPTDMGIEFSVEAHSMTS